MFHKLLIATILILLSAESSSQKLAVFDLGNDATTVVRNGSIFITYSGFVPQKMAINKGDTLSHGSFMGLLNSKENGELKELLIMITIKDLRNYSFNQLVQFIRENMNTAKCEDVTSYE
jgi:hypothetical protein